MVGSKKRKRDAAAGPVVTYNCPEGRSFARILKDNSLAEFKQSIISKLDLPTSTALKVYHSRDGKKIDLDDDQDFEAFQQFGEFNPTLEVNVELPNSGSDATTFGSAQASGLAFSPHQIGGQDTVSKLNTTEGDRPQKRKKVKHDAKAADLKTNSVSEPINSFGSAKKPSTKDLAFSTATSPHKENSQGKNTVNGSQSIPPSKSISFQQPAGNKKTLFNEETPPFTPEAASGPKKKKTRIRKRKREKQGQPSAETEPPTTLSDPPSNHIHASPSTTKHPKGSSHQKQKDKGQKTKNASTGHNTTTAPTTSPLSSADAPPPVFPTAQAEQQDATTLSPEAKKASHENAVRAFFKTRQPTRPSVQSPLPGPNQSQSVGWTTPPNKSASGSNPFIQGTQKAVQTPESPGTSKSVQAPSTLVDMDELVRPRSLQVPLSAILADRSSSEDGSGSEDDQLSDVARSTPSVERKRRRRYENMGGRLSDSGSSSESEGEATNEVKMDVDLVQSGLPQVVSHQGGNVGPSSPPATESRPKTPEESSISADSQSNPQDPEEPISEEDTRSVLDGGEEEPVEDAAAASDTTGFDRRKLRSRDKISPIPTQEASRAVQADSAQSPIQSSSQWTIPNQDSPRNVQPEGQISDRSSEKSRSGQRSASDSTASGRSNIDSRAVSVSSATTPTSSSDSRKKGSIVFTPTKIPSNTAVVELLTVPSAWEQRRKAALATRHSIPPPPTLPAKGVSPPTKTIMSEEDVHWATNYLTKSLTREGIKTFLCENGIESGGKRETKPRLVEYALQALSNTPGLFADLKQHQRSSVKTRRSARAVRHSSESVSEAGVSDSAPELARESEEALGSAEQSAAENDSVRSGSAAPTASESDEEEDAEVTPKAAAPLQLEKLPSPTLKLSESTLTSLHALTPDSLWPSNSLGLHPLYATPNRDDALGGRNDAKTHEESEDEDDESDDSEDDEQFAQYRKPTSSGLVYRAFDALMSSPLFSS